MKSMKLAASATLLAAMALALSACSTDAPAAQETGAAPTLSAEFQSALDSAYKGIGGDLALEPVTPQENVNLYVVSCGEQVPGCSTPAAGVVEAAQAIGWKTTIADGKLNPEGFSTAIRQSIAGGADVIVPVGIGCGAAQAAFKEAADAGIKIIGGGGVDDCVPKLWASERLWIDGQTPKTQWSGFGKLQAQYATGKTGGNVKAVVLNFTGQTWGPWVTEGFTEELTSLGGGEVMDTVDVSDPEQADGSYLQKVTTALLNNPEANTVIVPIDGWLATGLSQAIVQTGKDSELLVIGRGGDEPVIDMIRKGNSGVDATIGFATRWGAWGSIDTAARILDGKDAVWIGDSMQAVDAGNNLPASGDYMGSLDFKSVFIKAWGK